MKKKEERLQIRVDEELKAFLEQHAKDTNSSVSSVVRQAIVGLMYTKKKVVLFKKKYTHTK